MLVSFELTTATMSKMLDSICAQLKFENAKVLAVQNDLIQPQHTSPIWEIAHSTVQGVRTNHSFTSE